MLKSLKNTLLTCILLACTTSVVWAHCQVPCGIFADQLRFEQMLEDCQTITKAQLQVGEMAKKTLDAQGYNQVVRWVTTKEDHAGKIQETIASYFMAQRIKPDAEGYEQKLKAAHAVTIAAMKSKQSTDPATGDVLEKAILDFYRAYEGKEPIFEHGK